MIKDDVQLIQRILSGDDEAFGILVQKYRKGVHALVWRKIGDFHYAEEITQDVFLQVYKKLGTLKNPSQFSDGSMSLSIGSALIGSEDTNLRCNHWTQQVEKR